MLHKENLQKIIIKLKNIIIANPEKEYTINDFVPCFDKEWSSSSIRKALARMETDKFLKVRRYAHNLYKYHQNGQS
jgi:hypothetical protein